ncbi:MAG: DUF559 domain-containing protein [Eggerthellaceae bacterium]|nr:DUF559 domain-containing protein [Eggerthellaceae bacterium]
MSGVKQARKAASWVLDQSYSIKESQLAMLLSLPRKQNGRGLEMPVLNNTIIPDSSMARFLSQTSYTVDFMWPLFSLILEYDSKFHERRLEQDARRRNELQMLGFKVIQATVDDTKSAYNIAKLAMKIRNEMFGTCDIGFGETTTKDIHFHKEVMQLSNYP